MLAKDLNPGITVTLNGSQLVTVSEILRRDSKWVSNGQVWFRATDGLVYGLDRLHRI